MKKYLPRMFVILFLGLFGTVRAAVVTNSAAPNFTLSDINGNKVELGAFKGKFVVLEWTNFGCPFVRKHYNSGNMQKLQSEFTKQGVIWLSICSSAKGKEGNHTPSEWKKLVLDKKSHATSILIDESGAVGKLYGAKTTPHMFIINPAGNLIYQGGIDSIASADPVDIPKAINYVRQALNEALSGKNVTLSQTDSYGCSVKY